MACSIGGQLYRLYGDLKAAQKILSLGMSENPQHFGDFECEIYYCMSLITEGKLRESSERLERFLKLADSLHLAVISLPGRMIYMD